MRGATDRAPRVAVDFLRLAEPYLARHGCPSPRLDAEVLLAHVLGTSRLELYTRLDQPLEPDEVDAYREALRRRANREPVAYIVGYREFYGLRFGVDRAVLVPRPETEYLVELALRAWQGREGAGSGARAGGARFVDVGTGSGALAVTLTARVADWEGIGSDVSPAALACARDNARRHQLLDRLAWVRGDALSWAGDETFDLVVANPPYVPTDTLDGLAPEIRRYEPRLALDGGPDGLSVARRVAEGAARVLRAGGLLAMELGSADQARDLAAWLRSHAASTLARVAPVRDPVSGTPALLAQRPGTGPLAWPATPAEELAGP
ncbi:peptide chain release factor N(5)-glutamine methyltransferase [Geochorda subterranea]|uniref:Release factor glutamine methyltransferase n=1 Tax=Geochorda subterranea TaxID=3109564 RepID=A0ABZ1BQV7_9FIRM|nr:peptide chain release factor N(5)-glutamine methyltransferase [Limnochorda sp. LNt]WRP14821.1 peptide chain release factor N(5)-glutamine methyltransferase [Limnochorda sp. LNt]